MSGEKKIISLVKVGIRFTPFYFYNELLLEIAKCYNSQSDKDILFEFNLIEGDDLDYSNDRYFIDPISLPLLLSLLQQVKNYHNKPPKLHLSNTPITINILEFLFRTNFFFVAGDNTNDNFPLGRKILDFDNNYLKGFQGKQIRTEHKLRCYSINDDNLNVIIRQFAQNEQAQRDYLVEYFTYRVKEHFYDLLYENSNTSHLTNEFIEILAELITNGVLHSKSETFVLMFSDRFKTKFSISDNGIGLYDSLYSKQVNTELYEKFEIFNQLKDSFPFNIDFKIKKSILIIFETLYYSMLKDRQGLFDLMCKIVIDCNGYFRLHTENAQIIVSARMLDELIELNETRTKILIEHNTLLFNLKSKDVFNKDFSDLKLCCKQQILKLANTIFEKYTSDIRYSALRIYEVKFKGVHLEVEIPNTIN